MSFTKLTASLLLSAALTSPSNATQPGSVAANDARVKAKSLIIQCLNDNPGLEDRAKSGGFMDGELDELTKTRKHIDYLKSKPQDRANEIMLKDAEAHLKSIMDNANGFYPLTGRTTYSKEHLTPQEVVKRLNKILLPSGKQCS